MFRTILIILALASFCFASSDTIIYVDTTRVQWNKVVQTIQQNRDGSVTITYDGSYVKYIMHDSTSPVFMNSYTISRAKQKSDSTWYDSAFVSAKRELKKQAK